MVTKNVLKTVAKALLIVLLLLLFILPPLVWFTNLKKTPGFQLTHAPGFDLQATKTHLDENIRVSSTPLP